MRDVSFTLRPGQIMALVGASGSGKSTLLSLVAGLTDADAGAVRLNDERVLGPSEVLVPGHPAIRIVQQEYALQPNVSVRDNIAYTLRFFAKTYRDYRVDELLRLCRLTGVADRLPRQISGGEKQRTAIARAVADPPAVLLLDEPFSHLDLPNRLIVQELLFELVRRNDTACLFVTHDVADALAIADTLGLLRDGRLIQVGAPVDVYHRPQTAYAAQMTGPVNLLSRADATVLHLPEPPELDQFICLRPEQLWLADAGIAAVVRAVFFRGSYYEIEVEAGRRIRLRLQTTRTDVRAGQRVHVELTNDPLWLLR